jgi:signal transduction histidine kinase
MLRFNSQTLKENTSLSIPGFIFYSPISILSFPVTVLVVNPGASFLLLTASGVGLTAVIFAFYLLFIWIDNQISTDSFAFKCANFLIAAVAVGAIRGYLFYEAVDALELNAPGSLLNRILASAATTLFWLCAANILINFSQAFRSRYEQSLKKFIERNLTGVPSFLPSEESATELTILQQELTKSLTSRLEDGEAQNLREVAELLKSKINLQLRPLSRRIWLRSLNEYPKIRYGRMLKDSINFLEFSKPIFVLAILFLALLSNLSIRSFTESLVRTSTFLFLLLVILSLARTRVFSNHYVYLVMIGIIPVIGSEFIALFLEYSGSWTATFLISMVAPSLMVVLSLFNLTLRDHSLIIELLESYEIHKIPNASKAFDVSERHLASYLHNSLQSELLAIAGQLEEAAIANDREKSSEILQRVSALINRSFIDDFQKFAESPLERLETVRKSWSGILHIEIDFPEALLTSPARNASLVQTIEEFAANSYRHGKATKISASAIENSIGLHLTLKSNGSKKVSTKRGLGSEWLDQIAIGSWKMESTLTGTSLKITI